MTSNRLKQFTIMKKKIHTQAKNKGNRGVLPYALVMKASSELTRGSDRKEYETFVVKQRKYRGKSRKRSYKIERE